MNVFYIAAYGMIAFAIMAFAVVFLFIRYFKRTLQAERDLHEAAQRFNEEVITSNLLTLEKERKRFAEDLHDEIGASLSAIRLFLTDSIKQSDEQKRLQTLQLIKETIDEALAKARRISHNILPPGLEHMGLPVIMEDQLRVIASATPITYSVTLDNQLPKLNHDAELVIYRMLQELIQNTIKHGNARHISINFYAKSDDYCIEYTDNGKGFDTLNIQQQNGIGLQNIRNRAKMLGGICEFSNTETGGFKAAIVVPKFVSNLF